MFEKLTSRFTSHPAVELSSKVIPSPAIIPDLPLMRRYMVGDLQMASIPTDDVFYSRNEPKGFQSRKIMSLIGMDSLVQRTAVLSHQILEDDSNDQGLLDALKPIIQEIEDDLAHSIFWQAVEFGRITASAYGRFANAVERLTISSRTRPRVLLDKLLVANKAIHEFTDRDAKLVMASDVNYKKLMELPEFESISADQGLLRIPGKTPLLLSVQRLPASLDASDPLCLLVTAVDPSEEMPALVGLFNDLKVEIYTSEDPGSYRVELSQSWALKSCGTKPEFYYVRFFET